MSKTFLKYDKLVNSWFILRLETRLLLLGSDVLGYPQEFCRAQRISEDRLWK